MGIFFQSSAMSICWVLEQDILSAFLHLANVNTEYQVGSVTMKGVCSGM